MAKRRCLLVLNVLSGERPVTDVIAEAKISRGTYYQLESKALQAMIAALQPGAASAEDPSAAASKQIAELEAKVAKLEKELRRKERLLLLTRKVVGSGPVTTARRGRPRKSKKKATARRGRASSAASRVAPVESSGPGGSSPTRAGAAGPCSGNES